MKITGRFKRSIGSQNHTQRGGAGSCITENSGPVQYPPSWSRDDSASLFLGCPAKGQGPDYLSRSDALVGTCEGCYNPSSLARREKGKHRDWGLQCFRPSHSGQVDSQ